MTSYCDLSIADFIEQAASASPTPGGGAVAALAGALGGSMAAMAANFTVGKPRFAQYDKLMREIMEKLEGLIQQFAEGVDDDAAAFSRISEAYRLPKETEEEKEVRRKAIADALADAMEVPMVLLRRCAKAVELLPSLAGASNPNLLSDVEVAGIMLEAAARAAMTNVLVNSRQLRTERARQSEREAVEHVKSVTATTAMVTDIIARRAGAV